MYIITARLILEIVRFFVVKFLNNATDRDLKEKNELRNWIAELLGYRIFNY